MAEAGDLPGWRVFGPEQMRRSFTRSVDVLSRAPVLAHPLVARIMAPDVTGALDDRNAHCLLSDENLLGPIDPSVLSARGLYPNAGRHLPALRRLIGRRREMRVVVAVRNYATWWPSAYAMMSLRRTMPPIEALTPVWLQATRRWPDVIRSIADEFGGCDVLCYEALEDDPLAHLRALVGDLAEGAPQLRLHKSFSTDTLRRIGAGMQNGSPPSPETLRALRREDTGDTAHSLVSADDQSRLTELYLRDLDNLADAGGRICVGPPDRLL